MSSWYDDLLEEDARWGGIDSPRWSGLARRHMTLAQFEEVLKKVDARAIEYRKWKEANGFPD